ncbi:CoxG family protein [Alicyclobacillus mengziensis]|uniref:Carbon monoxide dehydrogenase subunit G n=1 Tax=Alicyclobacillus mengziensis TaxID=2931921 RepID=A0A9X7Z6Q3_9BACL|nr:carbon monoxide dehydrogenase subunit G [Alicyclobacillus mengziensis]QSO46490.1 carbon monoxide dehydrogenase subunit G [Alicyclobacillus mengziensis]
MRITFQHTYAATREKVWELLQDQDTLVRTLPGCKRLHSVGDGLYETELGLDVGPIKGLFAGHVQLCEQEAPARYRLKLSGRGKPGELSADSWVILEDKDGKTVVTCDADAQVTGLLASVGQRVTGSVARMLLGRFFKNVETELRRSAS